MSQVFIANGDLCAVDFSALELPISDAETVHILIENGFEVVDVNVTELARKLVGKAQYKKFCLPSEAPEFVDCSSLTKWIYGCLGIWLPRHPIDQREFLTQEVPWDEKCLVEGDLVFTRGRRSLYWDDPEDGVGHVGIVSSKNTIIDARSVKKGIVETEIAELLNKWENRGIRRVVQNPFRTFTFRCPEYTTAEWSFAFRWKILSSIGK